MKIDYGVHRTGRIRDIADGWAQLAMSIVLQARKDRIEEPLNWCATGRYKIIRIGDKGYKPDGCDEVNLRCVRNFFKSDWFNYLCDVAQVDATMARGLL